MPGSVGMYMEFRRCGTKHQRRGSHTKSFGRNKREPAKRNEELLSPEDRLLVYLGKPRNLIEIAVFLKLAPLLLASLLETSHSQQIIEFLPARKGGRVDDLEKFGDEVCKRLKIVAASAQTKQQGPFQQHQWVECLQKLGRDEKRDESAGFDPFELTNVTLRLTNSGYHSRRTRGLQKIRLG